MSSSITSTGRRLFRSEKGQRPLPLAGHTKITVLGLPWVTYPRSFLSSILVPHHGHFSSWKGFSLSLGEARAFNALTASSRLFGVSDSPTHRPMEIGSVP